MSRRIVTPNELDLESVGRRDYWVHLSSSNTLVPHLIPLTVMVGREAESNKGLVAFGGTHGNEYEGPVAIKNLLRELRTEDVLGRLILVPVLNVGAFNVGTRESTADDGLNLNRVFVAGAGKSQALGGITHRIVAFVRDFIWPFVHIVIDLRSCGEANRCAHYVSYNLHDDPKCTAEREELARWFGTPLLVRRPIPSPTSKLLIDDAERQGKMAFGSELGWGESVDVQGVRYARHGVLAAAIHHRQLRGETEPIGHHADCTQRLVEPGNKSAWVLAPYRGHYEPLVECGERVTRGQTVGYLHDFKHIDEEPHAIVAGVDGFVLSQAWAAPVEPGQSIFSVVPQVER